MARHLSRPLFFTVIATSQCTQTMAIVLLSSPSEQRPRTRKCIAGRYPTGTPSPTRSIPMRADAKFLSTGTSMELDTRGREAALRALTLIREDRTQRGNAAFLPRALAPITRRLEFVRSWQLFGVEATTKVCLWGQS